MNVIVVHPQHANEILWQPNTFKHLNLNNFAAEIFLTVSIILESLSTCCLNQVVHNRLFYIPAFFGYVVSFYLFPKALTKYSISVAYCIWSGVGILFIALYGYLIEHEVFTLKRICGMIMILVGIFLILEKK